MSEIKLNDIEDGRSFEVVRCQCGKKKYTKKEAQSLVNLSRDKNNKYHCIKCNMWHVTLPYEISEYAIDRMYRSIRRKRKMRPYDRNARNRVPESEFQEFLELIEINP